MQDQPSILAGRRPKSIDPMRYPALDRMRQHATQNGHAMIDRVYAEALHMHTQLKLYQDLYGPLEEEGTELL